MTNLWGQVLHATRALATELSRTVTEMLSNGAERAVEGLLVEPFAQLHRQLLMVRWAAAEGMHATACQALHRHP